jgi:hypothetical protein
MSRVPNLAGRLREKSRSKFRSPIRSGTVVVRVNRSGHARRARVDSGFTVAFAQEVRTTGTNFGGFESMRGSSTFSA